MATSETTGWSQTAGQLMLSAAIELGAVGMGDSLESTEQQEMQARLNGMLDEWSIEMNMFREALATITVEGGTGAVTLPTSVLDVRSVRHVVSSTNNRLLHPWNRDQFMRLPNRAQVGNPTCYYLSQQTEGDQLYIWPVPAADVTLELDYNRAFYYVEAPEQTLDLPPGWYSAMLYGLAARSANIFGRTTLDPSTIARIDAKSASSYDRLLDADRPDSYYFEYDSPVEAR